MLTQAEALDLLEYRDGYLYWKVPVARHRPGAVAGYQDQRFWRLTVRGKIYPVQKVIWLMHHGVLPARVRHIDGDRYNNRIENLKVW